MDAAIKEIKVSVIIPVYNSKLYLRECIESVISQTLDNYEIICVDDASSDGSNEILSEYEMSHSNLQVVRLEDNHGQAFARNIGIEKSKGKYIYFIDSDDSLVNDNVLKYLYDTAIGDATDCVLFDANIVYDNDSYKKQWKNSTIISDRFPEGIYTGAKCYQKMLTYLSSAVWRQFWKKDNIVNSKYGYFDAETSPVEDLLFTFRNIMNASKVSYVHKRLYNYRVRDNSSMTKKFDVQLYRAYSKCYVEALKFLRDEIHDIRQTLIPYFLYIKRRIKSYYTELFRMKQFEDMINSKLLDDFYFRLMLQDEYPFIDRFPTCDEFKKMDSVDMVVVYGGGRSAADIYRFLNDCEVNNVVLAVDEGNENHYTDKYSLKEINEFNSNVVIVLGAPLKYQEEMIKELKIYGFDNPIILNSLYI